MAHDVEMMWSPRCHKQHKQGRKKKQGKKVVSLKNLYWHLKCLYENGAVLLLLKKPSTSNRVWCLTDTETSQTGMFLNALQKMVRAGHGHGPMKNKLVLILANFPALSVALGPKSIHYFLRCQSLEIRTAVLSKYYSLALLLGTIFSCGLIH